MIGRGPGRSMTESELATTMRVVVEAGVLPQTKVRSPSSPLWHPCLTAAVCWTSWPEAATIHVTVGARAIRTTTSLRGRLWYVKSCSTLHAYSLGRADTHTRGYGYTSPHRGPYPPPPYGSSRRAAPPDPHTFDYPATLKQYAEWFRYYYPQQAIEEDNADKAAEQEAGDGSKPRNGIRTRWEKYKKDFSGQQVSILPFGRFSSTPFCTRCTMYDSVPTLPTLRTLFTEAETETLACSFKECLSIIGSRPGLQRSTTPLPSWCSCVLGCGRSGGRGAWIASCWSLTPASTTRI